MSKANKSKKFICSLMISLLMPLVLALSAMPFPRTAAAETVVPASEFIQGGQEYTAGEINGSISKENVTVTDENGSSLEPVTYSGALLTTTDSFARFDLGVYDLSGATAEKPIIGIMPWMKRLGESHVGASYGSFIVTFSSGDKSFSVTSFSRTDNFEMGLGAYGENQRAVGWNSYSGMYDLAIGPVASSIMPFRLDGSYVNRRFAFSDTVEENPSTYNSTMMPVPINIYLDKSNSDYTVYTDMIAAAWGLSKTGQQAFTYNGETTYRYKMRNLTESAGSSIDTSIWTPFTEEEEKNVKITVALNGVKSESKLLITSVNGEPVTDVSSMRIFKGIKTSPYDGITKTLTSDDKTLTVGKQVYLADNDVFTPLAEVALFPKQYGEKYNLVFKNDYTVDGVLDEEAFNAACAAADAKFTRDVDAVYIDFTDGENVLSVKLGYRPVDDSAGEVMFRVKTSLYTDGKYYTQYLTDNSLTSAQSAGSSPIRFDGFVQADDHVDENGNAINGNQYLDPVYRIYYSAEENALYTDSGRIKHNTQINFGTAEKPLYRWKILDLDDTYGGLLPAFMGFGETPVTMSVTVDFHDSDDDGDLSDESASVMIKQVDGYKVMTDEFGNMSTAGTASNKIKALSDTVEILDPQTLSVSVDIPDTLQVYDLFEGWKTYTDFTVSVTDSNGTPVEIVGNSFTADKLDEYAVKYMNGDKVIASYTVKTALGSDKEALVQKFDKLFVNEGEVKDLYYEPIPYYVSYKGGGIMVETANADSVDATGHLYAWEGRGKTGLGVKTAFDVDITSASYRSSSDYDSLIKIGFPATGAEYKNGNAAITFRVNIYDAEDEDTYISLFMVTSGAGSSVRVKAVGTWENNSSYEAVRYATWNDADGNMVKLSVNEGIDVPDWNTGLEIPGSKISGADAYPIEVIFDNFTQRLYVAYGPDVYFVRDFASDSANGTNTFDGFESGKVRISAGVDMPNYRNKADGKSALYTRFCIMGIRGADFTAQGDVIPDNVIISYSQKPLAGDEVSLDGIKVSTVFSGEINPENEKISVSYSDGTEIVAKTDYVEGLVIPAEKIKAGTYKIAYENSLGSYEIPLTVKPAFVKPQSTVENVAVTVDGIDITELPEKSAFDGNHSISVVPKKGYEIKTLKVGGVSVLDQIDAVNGGTVNYSYVNGTAEGDLIALEIVVSPISYTINYQAENADLSGEYTTSFTVEDDVLTLPDATLDLSVNEEYAYFEFDGWYSGSEKVVSGPFVYPAQDITLVARFKEKTYTVTFDFVVDGIQNETFDYTYSQTDALTAKLNSIFDNKTPENSPENKYISGWYTDSDYTESNEVTVDNFRSFENLTIYAKWDDGKKVTFENCDIPVQIIVPGEICDEPASPVKTGYTFAGWYADASFTSEFDFKQPINEDTVIFAKWDINKYDVTVIIDNTETVIKNVDYGTAVSDIGLPAIPQKANYSAEWNVSGDTLVTDDMTIIAIYTRNSITVVFDSNGGSAVDDKTFVIGESVIAPADPVREGYDFVGWYIGDEKYVFGGAAENDLTLTAKWQEKAEVTPAPDTTENPDDGDKKSGCGKAASALASVFAMLCAVFVIKRRG